MVMVKHYKNDSHVPQTDKKDSEKLKNNVLELEGQLDTTVRNKMQIIPILTAQLKAVIQETDDAAGGLTSAFIGISRKAKQQLQAVQGLFGNLSENSSGSNILLQMQGNLIDIQNNFTTITSFFDKSTAMISEVVEQLSKINTFASDIEKIGKMTNILAINAAIEAAHTGEAGQGFKVIATEINTLSKNSNESIRQIAEVTKSLTSTITAIKQELEKVHYQSKSIGMRTDELFNQTTDKIETTLKETTEKVQSIANDAEGLSKEISKIVVSIQFQDITRQRIEHVIAPLELLNNDLTSSIDNICKNESDFVQREETTITDSLANQYTMESEREILRKFGNQESQ
jgi:methyl-accepting chemotaxis protein